MGLGHVVTTFCLTETLPLCTFWIAMTKGTALE